LPSRQSHNFRVHVLIMHLGALLLSLFAIITTTTGSHWQIQDKSQFHILKILWPNANEWKWGVNTFFHPYVYNWIACPTAHFDCTCFWGGENNAHVKGNVGDAFFQLFNFCGKNALNFYLDADCAYYAPSYQFYEAGGDGTVLGKCIPQPSSPFTFGSDSQFTTAWTICQNMTTAISNVTNPFAAENTVQNPTVTPPNFPNGSDCTTTCNKNISGRQYWNFDIISDYYVCTSSSISCA